MAIHASFISGLTFPDGIALDGSGYLFEANGLSDTVGKYNASSGAAINASFISGTDNPEFLAIAQGVPKPSSVALAGVIAVGLLTRRHGRA